MPDGMLRTANGFGRCGYGFGYNPASDSSRSIRHNGRKNKNSYCDTHYTPFDAGSYASATLFYYGGQAVNLAAQKLRSRLVKIASQTMEVDPEELELAEDRMHTSSTKLTLPRTSQSSNPARRNIRGRIRTYKRSRFSYLCFYGCRS